MSKGIILSSFVLLNIVAFGWMFAIPVMVVHIEDLFNYQAFFIFVLISTVSGLLSAPKFGEWIDRYGVKTILSIGLFLNLFFWLSFLLPSNFYIFCVAFFIEGISVSAILIARSPYVYEITKSKIDGISYEKVESIIKTIMLFVSIGLLVSGGYLYLVNDVLPFMVNFTIVLISLISALLIKNSFNRSVDVKDKKSGGAGFVSKLLNFKKENKQLYYLSTAEGVFTGLSTYLYFFVSIVLIERGVSPLFLSYLIAAVYIFRAIGSYLISINKSTGLMYLFSIIMLCALFSLYFLNNVILFAGIFVFISSMKEYIELYLTISVTEGAESGDRGFVRSYLELISNIVIIGLMLISYFVLGLLHVDYLLLLYTSLFLISFTYIRGYYIGRKLNHL